MVEIFPHRQTPHFFARYFSRYRYFLQYHAGQKSLLFTSILQFLRPSEKCFVGDAQPPCGLPCGDLFFPAVPFSRRLGKEGIAGEDLLILPHRFVGDTPPFSLARSEKSQLVFRKPDKFRSALFFPLSSRGSLLESAPSSFQKRNGLPPKKAADHFMLHGSSRYFLLTFYSPFCRGVTLIYMELCGAESFHFGRI